MRCQLRFAAFISNQPERSMHSACHSAISAAYLLLVDLMSEESNYWYAWEPGTEKSPDICNGC
ncbi:hypothetical protein T07_8647 [Trichinella nelsoni]|uniref:Uncharacterized protein n=1 Tax=Trichinella nelsoni TaxID=6336 RepID=A0A0V0S199_9BILA|nr:hypothetical protein T07_8647 [Trichinella nelsoni]